MKAIRNILVGLALVSSAAAYAYDMPGELYLIGDATPNGWNTGSAIPMTKGENNTFEWAGYMNPANQCELKFLGQKDWGPVAFYATVAGTEFTTAETQTFTVVYGGDDNKWKVTTPGYYKLTLALNPGTTDDKDAGTLTVNYLGNNVPEIYMLGMVPDKWSANEGLALIGDNGVFTWTGDINYGGEDKQFKFALGRGDWNQVCYIVPTEATNSVFQIEPGSYGYQVSEEYEGGKLLDWFWGIKPGQSGNYTITVDLNAKTVTLALNKLKYGFDKNNVEELYMLGLAANSFESKQPLQMERLGDGKFQWKGSLDYDTNDGNPEHPNKQFKFVTPTGEWNQVYYLVPTSAEADGYIEQLEPGEYDMKPCTWLDGQTGVDAFYGLKPGMKDNYIVTADVPNMKVKLERDTTTGVDEIAVEAEGAEEVYDLAGRRVDLDNAPAGIYIVRKGGETRKVAIR